MSELSNVVESATQNPVVEGSENAVNAAQEPTVEAHGAEANPQETQQKEAKPAQTREENAAIAAARRRAEADKAEAVRKAKDEAAAEIAKRFGVSSPDRPIQTFEDFEKFGLEMEMKSKEVDPETYKAIRENDPEVRRAKEILAQQEKQAKDLKAFGEFRAAFKEANGREFDITQDASVYADVKREADESGKDLTDVFARHHNKTLMARLAELEAKVQAQETNKANAATSPGSVKADGAAAGTDYISAEDVESHRGDYGWFRKNYDAIIKSRPKWGG